MRQNKQSRNEASFFSRRTAVRRHRYCTLCASVDGSVAEQYTDRTSAMNGTSSVEFFLHSEPAAVGGRPGSDANGPASCSPNAE